MTKTTVFKTNLLHPTSDLYGKRLVREIRSHWDHGVYLDAQITKTESNPRVQAARFGKSGAIIVDTNQGQFFILPTEWEHAFFDGYGREIFASRS